MNESREKKGFDFLSSFYDFASRFFFGSSLLKSQIYFLPELKQGKSILIFGGGTGKILVELIKQNVGLEYIYVDISSGMIEKTKKRIAKFSPSQNIHFICGSYSDLPSNKKFDLIITPYVLDCFSDKELGNAMNALSSTLNTNGQWLFSDFYSSQSGLMKIFSNIIIRILYFLFNIICGFNITHLPDFEKEFSRLGYIPIEEKYFLQKLLASRIYERQV
jgi:ubiquinone/menaquinone biosynthesis C-methylase UbiE